MTALKSLLYRFLRSFFFSTSEFEIDEQNAPNDYRQHYELEKQLKNDEEALRTRVNDLKNRIELRRMLSEYESGALKPPIFYSDGIAEPEDQPRGNDRNSDDVEPDLTFFEELPSHDKRLVLSSQKNDFLPDIVEEIDTNYNEYPLKSLFREHQRPQYIIENIGNDEFDSRNNDPNEYHRRLFKVNRPRIDESSGVYTEGGLVYGPSEHVTSTQHRKRNAHSNTIHFQCSLKSNENNSSLNCIADNQGFNRTNLLDEILGFTRHERLDVKKPGPPADIPVEDHPAINLTATKSESVDVSVDGLLPKIKKVLHLDIEDDHGPHSVDTQYAHVILKTP